MLFGAELRRVNGGTKLIHFGSYKLLFGSRAHRQVGVHLESFAVPEFFCQDPISAMKKGAGNGGMVHIMDYG